MFVQETLTTAADTRNLPGDADVRRFITLLRQTQPDVAIDVDKPAQADGNWWLDITLGAFHTAVLWRDGFGFGIFTAEDGYDERPDERYKHGDIAARRLLQLAEAWNQSATLHPMWLKDIRALVNVPQTVVADKLNVKQAAISKLESRGDVKLSTLRAYFEALGGRVEMRVRFDDFDADIALPEAKFLEEV